MKKLDVRQAFDALAIFGKKNAPSILIGVGLTGLLIAPVMGIMATPKALRLIDEEKERRKKESKETGVFQPMTKFDHVKVAGRCYIPTVGICIVSAGCIIGANSVSGRRNAALATAYGLSERSLKEYQKKVVETVGEKKEKEVRDAVAKDRVDLAHVNTNTSNVYITPRGTTLCMDAITGRLFQSDREYLRKVENDLNLRLRDEMYISLNEYYAEIGGIPLLRRIGEDLGWNLENGYIELEFSSQLTEDGKPCLYVDSKISPRTDYRSLH